MARKRHLASSARGLLCFCLMTLVTTGLTRSIRPIRVRNKPILWRTALQAALVVCYLYRGRCPRLLFGSALQAPECMRDTCDVTTILIGYDAAHKRSAAWRAVP